MKKQNSVFYHVLVFVLAQVAWFSLLGLWIYWYVSNYLLLSQMGRDAAAPQILPTTHIGALVGGIILMIAISVGMSLIFVYLTRQVNLTRLYDNFIANVTHELKSPLSSIQLYLETLIKRKVPSETQREFVTTMLKDTERLNNLITSILDIAGLEQKKLAYDFAVYPADHIILKLLRETLEAYKLKPESYQVEGHLDGEIVLDQRAMKIVFNNLTDNALKYSKGNVFISIALSQDKKNFQLQFSDRGIGLRIKDHKMIFKKFERIYKADSPNVKGSGLGLYWVREIIRSHGGTISVSSAGSGKGTTFHIHLPIYQTSKRRFTNRLLELTRRRKMEIAETDEE
jgi:signal transduction histidine kinase